MKEILLLTDYKDVFGSKYNSFPYRSGFRKDLIAEYLLKEGFKTHILNFCDIKFDKIDFKNKIILYSSSEEKNFLYKEYIEDIILGLSYTDAIVIPHFKFLRANNNKVFMEILRGLLSSSDFPSIETDFYGSFEEFIKKIDNYKNIPYVVKSAKGSMSRGVALAKNKHHLEKTVKKISNSFSVKHYLKESYRRLKHKGYIKESEYEKKFIIQNFIGGLDNDWKVLIFGDDYYIFQRPNRKNDFRASGSGHDIYLYGDKSQHPKEIFDFAQKIFKQLDVPHLSLDIAYKNGKFYLLEFQAIYFGLVGYVKSNCYFKKINNEWMPIYEKPAIEKIYADSIIKYIKEKQIY